MNDEHEPDVNALATIPPERQTAILAGLAMWNPGLRRRLQFELAVHGNGKPGAAAHRWMVAFCRETAFLDRDAYFEVAREYEALRAAIATDVARLEPGCAFDLMWTLLTLAGGLHERTTEDGWEVSQTCREACVDVVRLSIGTGVESGTLAARVVDAIDSDGYGESGGLVPAIAAMASWAPDDLVRLKVAFQQVSDEAGPTDARRQVVQRLLRELDAGKPPRP
jgi:hypothetical protein